MKQIVYTFVLLLISLPTFINANFTDIADHEYRDSILYLQSHEVVKGYPDGSYGPDREITRAELLKIILESSTEDQIVGSTNCFADIEDHRGASYICFAKQREIVRGYPDGTFKPEQAVTIAEALKITLESFDLAVEEGEGKYWYQPYFDFVHTNNIFSTYALLPDAPMTRGMMAYLAHQLMLEQEGSISFTNKRDSSSAGCGLRPPSSPPDTVIVDGQTRSFITDLGGGTYDRQEPRPLIIAFHGRTNPNTMVRRYYDIDNAAGNDAIIVYPSGLPEEGPSRNRSSPGDPSDQLRDFALFDEIVEEFTNTYCIDTDQIYVAGHSLGAWFANTLACARGDVIRGIGSVGGSTTANECTGPVAALIMHNPEDRLAGFGGGLYNRDQILAQNSCGTATRPVGPAEGNCVEYTDCQAGAPVIWCPHGDSYEGRDSYYYPHTWPDFAGQMIWEFFEEQGAAGAD